MTTPPMLEQCQELDWESLCHLYAQLLREAPTHIDLPARALRQKARSGEIPPEGIPVLMTCLMGAEEPTVIVELAKALAAFGRRAELGASILIEKLKGFIIGDDAEFWALDGCLYALGYLGGEAASPYVDGLIEAFSSARATFEETRPASDAEDAEELDELGDDEYVLTFVKRSTGTWVTRTGDLYKGDMSADERDAIYAETLAEVRDMLEQKDEEVGAWTVKRSDHATEAQKPAKKLPAWRAMMS